MQVAQKFWDRTQIGSVLDIFSGQIGEMLQRTTGSELARCKEFLPYIFWRWQFLRLAGSVEEWTPFEALDHFRKKEKWPKDGQFCCQPVLEIKDGKVVISINTEYLNFLEQPLLVKEGEFGFGERFDKERKLFAEVKFSTTEEAKALIKGYFLGNLEIWQAEDPFISECYSRDGWRDFWLEILKKSGKNIGVGTNEVMDRFILNIRKKYPGFGITNQEMRDKKHFSEEKRMIFYHFWLNACLYVFFPLSLFLDLVGMGFIDDKNFQYDVKDLLTNYYKDPIPMISPPTYFYLTPFGKQVFN